MALLLLEKHVGFSITSKLLVAFPTSDFPNFETSEGNLSLPILKTQTSLNSAFVHFEGQETMNL